MMGKKPAKDSGRGPWHPQKHLGQNFLIDKNIIQKIIAACAFQEEDHVLEIGPGHGALTQHIAPRVQSLLAIEADARVCETLKPVFPQKHVHIINADFLKFDMSSLPSPLKVVGNLPYYISSPILEKLMSCPNSFSDIFITVQHEFGKRLTAHPHTKDYGSLSCFVQYHAEARKLFLIRPSCFRPVPKVMSCFLHLSPREKILSAKEEDILFKIIRTAFQHRRKTIINALSDYDDKQRLKDIFHRLNFNIKARPENFTLQDYCKIAKAFGE